MIMQIITKLTRFYEKSHKKIMCIVKENDINNFFTVNSNLQN